MDDCFVSLIALADIKTKRLYTVVWIGTKMSHFEANQVLGNQETYNSKFRNSKYFSSRKSAEIVKIGKLVS